MALLERARNWIHPKEFEDTKDAQEHARKHYLEHVDESARRKGDFLPREYLVEEYMIIPAGTFRRGASAPDQGVEGTFATLLFADNVTEEAFVNVHIPSDWSEGTDLKLAVYWALTSALAGHVAWEFDWVAVNTAPGDEVIGGAGTHVDIHDDTLLRDNEILETSYGTIAGASLAVDDTVGIKLYRDHDDAGDNYVGDAALIHMEIKYYSDTLGEDV